MRVKSVKTYQKAQAPIAPSLAFAVSLLIAAVSFAAQPPAARKPAGDSSEKSPTEASQPPAEREEPVERLAHDSEFEVLFEEGINAVEYARQIDFFGIELGAIDKNGQIQYASHLSQPKPERRTGPKSEETRLNILWKRGSLASHDAKLLRKAGISTNDKTLGQFYPLAVEQKLLRIQKLYAGHDASEISRTRFKVRPQAANPRAYEFYVDEQDLKAGGQAAPRSSASTASPGDAK